MIAVLLNNLGDLALRRGDDATAQPLIEESLAMNRGAGDKQGIAYSLTNLGALARHRADYAAAQSLLEESLVIRRQLRDKRGIADSLEGFAALASAQRHAERAATLFGAADSLRETIGVALSPAARVYYGGDFAGLRTALGKEAFEAAWAEGRAMTLEQAIEYALGAETD